MSGYKPHRPTNTNQPHRLQRVHSEPSISRSPTLLSFASCTESKPPSSPIPANSAPSISLLSESCTETVVFSEKKHRKKSNHKNSSKKSKKSKKIVFEFEEKE